MIKKGQISLQNIFFNTDCYNALSMGTGYKDKLYNIWSKSSKVRSGEYKIPENCLSDIEDLNRTGYVTYNKYSFTITPKGSNALKEVILNDTKSAFDEE